VSLGVWIPHWRGTPRGTPADWPLGRAALALEGEGTPVILGQPSPDGTFVGHRAVPGKWEVARGPVAAVFDRYPGVSRAEAWQAGLRALRGVPVGNDPALTRLCRDKVATQRRLEAAGLALPPVEADPARFPERLEAWGAAFLKPRHGALGEGVRRVVPGAPLPRSGPWILQRAVPPPAGLAGVSARVLAQRDPDGRWVACPPAVRRSREDPVVNAARGAEVVTAEIAGLDGEALQAAAVGAAAALGSVVDGPAVELGVDLVVDPEGAPWIIEVNGRPRGRLAALAARDPARFGPVQDQAARRPLQRLRALAAG
jgi:hypothetical protein